MKQLGLLIFVVGVSLAGMFASRPGVIEHGSTEEGAQPTASERLTSWFDVAGLPFLGSLAVMVAGGVVARRGGKTDRKRRPGGESGDGEGTGLQAGLDRVGALLDSMPENDVEKNAALFRDKLDELIEDAIPSFLEQRLHFAEDLGLAKFAEMIGHFASAERNSARAWSALTDEAWEEVIPSLDRAKAGLQAARDSLAEPSA